MHVTPLHPNKNQSNIHEVLRPDENLKSNVSFRLYLSHDWANFATTKYLALATHALRTMSVWLRCATNEGHFAYRAHYLFASICASIRVTFLKLYVRAQISLLHLMYKRED